MGGGTLHRDPRGIERVQLTCRMGLTTFSRQPCSTLPLASWPYLTVMAASAVRQTGAAVRMLQAPLLDNAVRTRAQENLQLHCSSRAIVAMAA